jgi:hypothetical protein
MVSFFILEPEYIRLYISHFSHTFSANFIHLEEQIAAVAGTTANEFTHSANYPRFASP